MAVWSISVTTILKPLLTFANFYLFLLDVSLKHNFFNFFFSRRFKDFMHVISNIHSLSSSLVNSIDVSGLTREFKSLFMYKYASYSKILKFSTKPKFFYMSKAENLFLIKSFTTFININMFHSFGLRTHSSFFSSYLCFNSANISVISIRRFFMLYKHLFHFLINIFYYKIPILTFGNSYFKKEILSLNWSYLSKFSFIWRFTKPFLVLAPNKIRDDFYAIFKNLRRLNFHTAFVLDIFYHDRTIHYLNKLNFFSFGLVPVNTNKYTVNFAMPTGRESVFSQVFFTRFLLKCKKQTEISIYNNFFNKWIFLQRNFLKTKAFRRKYRKNKSRMYFC